MGTKEAVSNAHMNALREQHVQFATMPLHRTALVFGSNQRDNIGHVIALHLMRQGWAVVALSEADCDVRSSACVKAALDSVHPDTVICAQGYSHMDWIEEQSEDDSLNTLEVNLVGNINITREFVRLTLPDRWLKHLVYIGSMAHNHVLNASAAYCASKAGLQHYARCAAWELAPKGYFVYCVNPSNVQGTPMTEATIRGIMRTRQIDYAAAEAYWGAVLPMAHWLQPQEIARTVAMLVSGEHGYLSGSAIDLPGGQR